MSCTTLDILIKILRAYQVSSPNITYFFFNEHISPCDIYSKKKYNLPRDFSMLAVGTFLVIDSTSNKLDFFAHRPRQYLKYLSYIRLQKKHHLNLSFYPFSPSMYAHFLNFNKSHTSSLNFFKLCDRGLFWSYD